MHETSLSKRPTPVRAMSTGRAFMKRRSDRMEELATVYSQEPLKEPLRMARDSENLGMQKGERAGCLSKIRQWTNKLLHRKRETME
jgi:hypothetical protein